jgi:hypothetical protein
MVPQQRQNPPARTSRNDAEAMLGLSSALAAGCQRQKWQQEQEKEWECHLRNLRQCLCELLIRNQQLRESLMSASNHQVREGADEYDQNLSGN